MDLAGQEAAHEACVHEEAFAHARKWGVHVTVHAGEAAGVESIGQATTLLGAERRIGHGTRLFTRPRETSIGGDQIGGDQHSENADAQELAKRRRICFEVCPTSNLQTMPEFCRDYRKSSKWRSVLPALKKAPQSKTTTHGRCIESAERNQWPDSRAKGWRRR